MMSERKTAAGNRKWRRPRIDVARPAAVQLLRPPRFEEAFTLVEERRDTGSTQRRWAFAPRSPKRLAPIGTRRFEPDLNQDYDRCPALWQIPEHRGARLTLNRAATAKARASQLREQKTARLRAALFKRDHLQTGMPVDPPSSGLAAWRADSTVPGRSGPLSLPIPPFRLDQDLTDLVPGR